MKTSENKISVGSLLLRFWPCLAIIAVTIFYIGIASAAETRDTTNQVSKAASPKPLSAVLAPTKWQQVENTVDRGLAWIASQQAADGSFSTLPQCQPGVSSLCIMAFLSRGHQPGVGPYGKQIERAIDFVISCQMQDGMLCLVPPESTHMSGRASHTATYNHAISGLMLGEVYGQVSGLRAKATKQSIEKALKFTRQLQLRSKSEIDKGGWRYIRLNPSRVDSDISITGWQIMFLRSAKNAEFDVPQNYVEEATAYVHRLWESSSGGFHYRSGEPSNTKLSRGLVGAGILSLSLAGEHQSPQALSAGDWLLARPFNYVGESVGTGDRFFYGAYYCSQAAAQLGGRYWEGIYPHIADALLRGQLSDGSWPPEKTGDGAFGNTYTSAMAVLSLTPPYQLLPVYQR